MDRDYIKKYVMTMLGGGDNDVNVSVELNDNEFDIIIDNTERWYNTYKGFKRFILIQIVTEENEYEMPPDTFRVVDVIPPGYEFDISKLLTRSLFPVVGVPYDIFGAVQRIGMYSTFTQTLQYNEMAKRILSNEFEWEYRQEENKLIIYPYRLTSGKMCVIYVTKDIRYDRLTPMDEDFILQYALAQGKIIVGRKRSKFSDFPMVEGSQKLDGETLISEAKEEIEVLTKKLQESNMPIRFTSG